MRPDETPKSPSPFSRVFQTREKLNARRQETAPPPPPATSRFLRPRDLRRFQNFQFAAKIVVEGFYSGRHRSPYYDESAEFADYRPYVPGDEIRSLDWRAYARTDRDYVKLFRKETDMRCHVLLDASHSMAFGEEEGSSKEAPFTKFEYGAYLSAALCYLIVKQGDKASLALGASGLKTYVPPGGTMTHLHRLLFPLEQTKPNGPTSLASALKGMFALTQRRGLLVVVSDLLEESGPLFDALAMYSHRGWQILLLHVLTDTELNLPGEGPARYLDSEGPGQADADPDALRDAYQAEIRFWLDELENQSKARRIHYVRTTTSTPYDRALEHYLTARAR